MPKVERKKVTSTALVLIIVLLFLTLAFKLDSYQKELEIARNNGSQVSELLYGENNTPGLSCGILNQAKAEEILGANLDRNFVQGPDNLVTASTPDKRVLWVDSCRYSDSSNSSKYVELYINSYQTPLDAKLAYPDIFGKVNEKVEISADGIGDKLAYDGGAFYLLKDSRIIRVAASNGSEDIKSFSRGVFDNLISGLDL